MLDRFKWRVRQQARRRIPSPLLTRLRAMVRNPDERWQSFSRCFDFILQNDIEGDVFEFGIFEGASLAALYHNAKRASRERGSPLKRRFFGFDSFEGLSEPGEADTANAFSKGMFACRKDEVLNNLKRDGVELRHVHLIEGWFENTLQPELRASLGVERACFINVDCDLCEPARSVLAWCEPLMHQGTLINFDDWHCSEGRNDCGERRAVAELLEAHPDMRFEPFARYRWHAQTFLIHRAPPAE